MTGSRSPILLPLLLPTVLYCSVVLRHARVAGRAREPRACLDLAGARRRRRRGMLVLFTVGIGGGEPARPIRAAPCRRAASVVPGQVVPPPAATLMAARPAAHSNAASLDERGVDAAP